MVTVCSVGHAGGIEDAGRKGEEAQQGCSGDPVVLDLPDQGGRLGLPGLPLARPHPNRQLKRRRIYRILALILLNILF